MKLLVQIENGQRRETCMVEFQDEAALRSGMGLRLIAWLASAISAVGKSGVCKSFVVSVHNLAVPCDHEVGDVDSG